MTAHPARSREQRKADVLAKLQSDVDAWVATGGEKPYLVPLSFLWDGESLLFATPTSSVTIRNLTRDLRVRIGLGSTRDVVMIDGNAEIVQVNAEAGDTFARRTGFDPRELSTAYSYFRAKPTMIQAWREANELEGRTVMRDGSWLA